MGGKSGWIKFPLASLRMSKMETVCIFALGKAQREDIPVFPSGMTLLAKATGEIWLFSKDQNCLEPENKKGSGREKVFFVIFSSQAWYAYLKEKHCQFPIRDVFLKDTPRYEAISGFLCCMEGISAKEISTGDDEVYQLWFLLEDILWQLCSTKRFWIDRKAAVGWMKQVITYVDAHFREDISLTELSERVGMTPQHISRCFHREMGIPLVEYMARKRIGVALELLWKGDIKETRGSTVGQDVAKIPLNKVASYVGYASPAYFCKVFRRFVGAAPDAFCRKKLPSLDKW